VLCAPSRHGESFGIVLLEAMAAGAPVLASDLDAFTKVLDGGQSGALFENGNVDDLAFRVTELLGDPGKLAALRAAAAETVARYDWVRVAQDVLAVYETVIPGQGRVREDTRLQVLGRFTRLRDES
jgi:phosphatidylinositol alpha-mannosyltransferase